MHDINRIGEVNSMKNVKILADSTCDLGDALIEKYKISVIPPYIQLDDVYYKDQLEITPKELFEWSDKNNRTPKTAAPGMEIVQEELAKYQKEDTDLIFFGISEDMSATCNIVRLVAKDMEYDNCYVIDSMSLSSGIGLQIVRAAELAASGMEAKEIVARIESQRDKVRASFVIDTLTYLHRGGRCSAMTAVVAGALKLKPRISVIQGKMDVTKKYRGNIASVIRKYTADLEPDLRAAEGKRVFITHSGCAPEIVEEVRQFLKGLNHFEEIHETLAGSVISSHCGPNTLGVLFYDA